MFIPGPALIMAALVMITGLAPAQAAPARLETTIGQYTIRSDAAEVTKNSSGEITLIEANTLTLTNNNEKTVYTLEDVRIEHIEDRYIRNLSTEFLTVQTGTTAVTKFQNVEMSNINLDPQATDPARREILGSFTADSSTSTDASKSGNEASSPSGKSVSGKTGPVTVNDLRFRAIKQSGTRAYLPEVFPFPSELTVKQAEIIGDTDTPARTTIGSISLQLSNRDELQFAIEQFNIRLSHKLTDLDLSFGSLNFRNLSLRNTDKPEFLLDIDAIEARTHYGKTSVRSININAGYDDVSRIAVNNINLPLAPILALVPNAPSIPLDQLDLSLNLEAHPTNDTRTIVSLFRIDDPGLGQAGLATRHHSLHPYEHYTLTDFDIERFIKETIVDRVEFYLEDNGALEISRILRTTVSGSGKSVTALAAEERGLAQLIALGISQTIRTKGNLADALEQFLDGGKKISFILTTTDNSGIPLATINDFSQSPSVTEFPIEKLQLEIDVH